MKNLKRLPGLAALALVASTILWNCSSSPPPTGTNDSPTTDTVFVESGCRGTDISIAGFASNYYLQRLQDEPRNPKYLNLAYEMNKLDESLKKTMEMDTMPPKPGTQRRRLMMFECCQCDFIEFGCCFCGPDTTKNNENYERALRFLAAPGIKKLSLKGPAGGPVLPASSETFEGFNSFSLGPMPFPDGKYILTLEGTFKPGVADLELISVKGQLGFKPPVIK